MIRREELEELINSYELTFVQFISFNDVDERLLPELLYFARINIKNELESGLLPHLLLVYTNTTIEEVEKEVVGWLFEEVVG